MSALALSILLSLVSAVAYAGGAIVQERVADSEHGKSYAAMRRPVWWAAVALNGFGGVLHVVALAYGPLSVVQPMGALTIVFALPMAALFVRRKAGATAWRGAIMATLGLAGLLSLVGNSQAHSLGTTQRVLLAVVTGFAVVSLMVAGRAAHRHPAVRSTLLAVASGIAFGMSSVFTKVVAVDWSGGLTAPDLPTLALIAVLGASGLLLSQAAYRGGGLAGPARHADGRQPGGGGGGRHHHVRRNVPVRHHGHHPRAGLRCGRGGRPDPAHHGTAPARHAHRRAALRLSCPCFPCSGTLGTGPDRGRARGDAGGERGASPYGSRHSGGTDARAGHARRRAHSLRGLPRHPLRAGPATLPRPAPYEGQILTPPALR
ncbi:drug/metabolite transporter (DMT)-like permease [Streptomyces turgidiscabies]|uniref:Drug/metabolite transporter (DMT)-like permease n=1 Tax=Streptomyces turgidiscabies TaxID=85558 RepID=A0ABU0RX80_9ACTN|nr:drug/metabolite transporter (DMT)-like permease [Streptomyces turgidiscabies]